MIMKSRKILVYSFLGIALLFLTTQCVSSPEDMGQVRPQMRDEKQMTIQMLEDNWQDYIIHKDGPTGGIPVAVIFDPKNDDKTIATYEWELVTDKQALLDAVGWIQSRPAEPKVNRIVGPNGELFGYVYTYNENIPMHVINDKKIFVDELVN
jgi:hypothetical protein